MSCIKNIYTHFEVKSATFLAFPPTPTHLVLRVSSGQAEASDTVATSDDTFLVFLLSGLKDQIQNSAKNSFNALSIGKGNLKWCS